MNGVSKISCENDIMLITFPQAEMAGSGLADCLTAFAQAGVNVDMISQGVPKGSVVDLCLTTSYDNWALVMRTLPHITAGKNQPAPLIGGGYSKINLFGQEMEALCGVAAKVLQVVAQAGVCVELVTTSSVDISLLVAAEYEDTALNALSEAFGL